MNSKNTLTIVTAIIFILSETLIVIGLINKSKYDNIIEVFVITSIFLIYSFLKAKFNLYMSGYITIIVILTIIGHNLIGEYFDVYVTSFYYDKFLHFFGTYAFTLFFYSIIVQKLPVPVYSRNRELIVIILLGIALGSVFELIEFFADVIFKPKKPNQESLLDTDLDMVFDLIGALATSIHAYLNDFKIFKSNSDTR